MDDTGSVQTAEELADVVNAIAQGDRINTLRIHRVGAKAQAFKADQAAFDQLSK